jgi:RecB family exonuclease
VASEAAFEVEHDGMLLRGSLDRVERDPDGRVVVVDFKTGRSAPSNAEVAAHAQLGVYQVAVREGGLEAVVPDASTELGGAGLVHLRLGTREGKPKVQHQPPLEPDGDDGLTWADRLLRRTAVGILAEEFPARVNDGCDRCVFRHACPARDEGGQVVR